MKGHYNRYTACEQCGTEFFVGNRACPQCGHARKLSDSTVVRDKQKEAGGYVRGPYKKTGEGKGTWTVSLNNGDKQIAAKVSAAVAKQILGLIFG